MKAFRTKKMILRAGAILVGGISIGLCYAFGNVEGRETGVLHGANVIRSISKEVYSDYDEKMQEYLDRDDSEDES